MAARNALCNKMQSTAKKIANGDLQEALDKIESDLLPKLDGDPSPGDWMVDSDDKSLLHDDLVLLASLITLELAE